ADLCHHAAAGENPERARNVQKSAQPYVDEMTWFKAILVSAVYLTLSLFLTLILGRMGVSWPQLETWIFVSLFVTILLSIWHSGSRRQRLWICLSAASLLVAFSWLGLFLASDI